ncbi:MAG: hypothetical protein JXA20_14825 [Spirochaetes bacterium]|nr:hypothetical protein [Spirochaetota bacterium]
MSRQEISQLIEKLRERYREFGKRYSPKWFDLERFEERYILAIEKGMNMEGFILAEIANFEKLRERYEKKKEQRSVSERIDRMVEEHTARIARYPEVRFHPLAGFEISRCYGAMADLALYYIAILWYLVADAGMKNTLVELEDRLAFLAMPRGSEPSKRIQDHCTILSRRKVPEIEIERDKNDYLKESAFLLHDIIDFCDRLLEAKDSTWENPLRFDQIRLEEGRRKGIVRIFSGMTGYGAILGIREYASGIVEDFRLGAFRKRGA